MTLRQDLIDKHGDLASGARTVGISRQALYALLNKIEANEKLRLSSYLLLARIRGISYAKFKKEYLTM